MRLTLVFLQLNGEVAQRAKQTMAVNGYLYPLHKPYTYLNTY